MNISFNQVENHQENRQVSNHSYNAYATGKETKAAKESSVFKWDHSGNGIGMRAYKNHDGSSKADLLDQAASFDEKNSKNFMVVMSNTMSKEDYQKMQENGGTIGDYEPGDMVTLMDQIKVTLAKSGVNIAGFTDTLDANAIKEAGLSEGYAQAIANALATNNLPATEDNIKGIATQMEQAEKIGTLTDGAKKYLIENDLPLTIDNLYKANFAGGNAGTGAQGYFDAGSYGYMAKKGTVSDLSGMEDQMKDVIEKSGLSADAQAMEKATWLLSNGLALTSENLHTLNNLDALTFPMDVKAAALAAADAISVGLSAKDANLSVGAGYTKDGAGYIEAAVAMEEQAKAITEDDLKTAIMQGKNLTLFTLTQIAKSEVKAQGDFSEPAKQTLFAESQKQLVQIQMYMSAQANLKLMKQGIAIDLEPLGRLAEMLEKEEAMYHATELSVTVEKTEAIKGLPEATIGISVKEAWMANRVYTLDHVYETGKALAGEYAKAGQTYEALMTAPRADLGDSIRTAFRNVDDLLSENGFDVSDENRKAVRILGYNQMEISEDNLQSVKAADAMLQRVLKSLTPEKTLHMLRDGVNPMTMNLDELANYLDAQHDESANLEKYSKYLYRLEKSNEISAEEKEAYIGVYRLLRQIEKGDDAAIGNVVSNNRELNLENLLSAVRTKKKGFIDAKVDDAFGLIKEIKGHGTSISDQIMGYFKNRASLLADEMQEFSSADDISELYEEESRMVKEAADISEGALAQMLEDGVDVNLNQIAAEQMLATEAGFIKDLKELFKKDRKEDAFLQDLSKLSDAFDEGEDSVKEAYAEFAKNATDALSDAGEVSTNHIDVRSYAFDMRQISLIQEHAKNENYYVPMELGDSVTMVHVKIVNGDKKGTVTIDLKETDGVLGKASAAFSVKGDKIEGLIGTAKDSDLEKYQKIAEKCSAFILEKTGKEADITCVYSQAMNLNAFYGEGKTASTKELYQVAKAFIQSIEQEVIGYES